MIVERTQYFAKPGRADDVLAIRRKACALRRDLGLASGLIFTKAPGSQADSPDVVWECRFRDAAAQQADLAARGASEAFEAVRREMTAAIDRFDRYVLAQRNLGLASGMRTIDLTDHALVPREIVFQSAGRELKGYLSAPRGEGPFPCLICNHGSGIEQGTFDVSRPGTAATLMSWGIASFLPHRRGYGNSPGPAWREEVSAEYGTAEYDGQLLARLDSESDDVVAALDCALALPEVDSRHVGVMGSSFGGTHTLFAAAKDTRFTCAIDFAGAAMNWDRTPTLRAGMIAVAANVTMPRFLIQAANDYSIRPTEELAASLSGSSIPVWSKVYPDFGINPMEGHLLESRGAMIWGDDVHRFLERYL